MCLAKMLWSGMKAKLHPQPKLRTSFEKSPPSQHAPPLTRHSAAQELSGLSCCGFPKTILYKAANSEEAALMSSPCKTHVGT